MNGEKFLGVDSGDVDFLAKAKYSRLSIIERVTAREPLIRFERFNNHSGPKFDEKHD